MLLDILKVFQSALKVLITKRHLRWTKHRGAISVLRMGWIGSDRWGEVEDLKGAVK